MRAGSPKQPLAATLPPRVPLDEDDERGDEEHYEEEEESGDEW